MYIVFVKTGDFIVSSELHENFCDAKRVYDKYVNRNDLEVILISVQNLFDRKDKNDCIVIYGDKCSVAGVSVEADGNLGQG